MTGEKKRTSKDRGSEEFPLLAFHAEFEGGLKHGSDPIPQDQYRTLMDKRYDPYERLWAWLLDHTIKLGHRHPYACDRKGNALTLRHAAAHLGMDEANVYRAWKDMEEDGRCWREWLVDGKWTREEPADNSRSKLRHRLVLAGDFKLRTRGEDKEKDIVWPDNQISRFQSYLAKIPPHFRAEAEKRILAVENWASGMRCGSRFIAEREHNITFASYGVKLPRQEHGSKEDRESRAQEIAPYVAALETLFGQTMHGTVRSDNVSQSIQTMESASAGPINGHFSEASEPSTEVKQSVGRSAGPEPAPQSPPTDRPTDPLPPELQTIKETIPKALYEVLKDSPTPELLRKIGDALQGAPPYQLTRRIYQRFQKITSFGMLLPLARDVGKAWIQMRQESPPHGSNGKSVADADTVEVLRSILNDPRASPEEKQQARDSLKSWNL